MPGNGKWNLDAVEGKLAKATIGKEIGQIEQALDRLNKEHAKQLEQLQEKTLTEQQIITIYEFADQMRRDIEMFRNDFESRRLFLAEIDMQVVLYIEDGQKMVEVSAKIGRKQLPVVSNSIGWAGSSKAQVWRKYSA